MSAGHDRTLVLGPDAREERVREILPDFDAIALATAAEHGVCLRPMLLEQHDTVTGTKEFVPVPCGNTQESVCAPCARKAQRLRMMQAREGWHLDHEPRIQHRRPSLDQQQLMLYRADVCALLEATTALGERAELTAEISWIDKQLVALGMRGRTPAAPKDADTTDADAADSSASGEPSTPHRSTRRDDDAPDLPRNPIDKSRTIGREYAGRYRPSMFITLTLDSYGQVHRDDGTPLDPERYDYQRAAWDAITFAALVDRFIQNLRRVIGWEIQYFATIEPQRRGAPHIHLALRGSVPRHLIRQVAAATYRNIWWPPIENPRYSPDTVLPVWDREQRTFVDPHTRQPLTDWDDAVADLDRPVHKARFGVQVHYKGILGGTCEGRPPYRVPVQVPHQIGHRNTGRPISSPTHPLRSVTRPPRPHTVLAALPAVAAARHRAQARGRTHPPRQLQSPRTPTLLPRPARTAGTDLDPLDRQNPRRPQSRPTGVRPPHPRRGRYRQTHP